MVFTFNVIELIDELLFDLTLKNEYTI